MQIRTRFDDTRDLGESVLALGEMEGTGQATRLNFTDENAQLVTYRGGKIVKYPGFPQPCRGPRSRRTVGVGDVAQELGGRAADLCPVRRRP
jgi:hypothetical protein